MPAASLDTAVINSINAGVSYAIAAGNSGANACNYSPARVDAAMTVGATDSSDTRASWSNYGKCVDWFAPGVNITSAWIGEHYGHEYHQWHQHGNTAHYRRRGAVSSGESECIAGAGSICTAYCCDLRCRQERRCGQPEPVAVQCMVA